MGELRGQGQRCGEEVELPERGELVPEVRLGPVDLPGPLGDAGEHGLRHRGQHGEAEPVAASGIRAGRGRGGTLGGGGHQAPVVSSSIAPSAQMRSMGVETASRARTTASSSGAS